MTPRIVTLTMSAGFLWFLAILGALGLALAVHRNLARAFRLALFGNEGPGRSWPLLGSFAALLLTWALWDWKGGGSAVVLILGFALADGALLLAETWSVTGGALLRRIRGGPVDTSWPVEDGGGVGVAWWSWTFTPASGSGGDASRES